MEKLRVVIKTTLVWGVLFLLVIAVRSFAQLPSIAGPLDSLFESFHVEDLYTYWMRDVMAEESSSALDDLVLVDVSGIQSRSELASLLNDIADAQPRAMVLDLIFAPLSMADSAQDNQLVSALKRFPYLILASNCHSDLQGVHQEHSFFADSLPNAIEGEAWLPGTVARTFSPIIEESGLPSLSYCAAEALGLDIPATTEQQQICYLPMSAFTFTPAREDINMDFLKDKVIFVGDAADLRDFHNVPLLTTSHGRMSGMMIHVAILLTMASETPVHYMPKWANRWMELVLLWLLCLLFCVWPFGLDNWYQAVVSLLLSIIVMAFGACVFASEHCIISMLLFLLGCPLAGFAKDVVDKMMSKCVK